MTAINPFLLERYFARYEFSASYLLSPSDCESLTLRELLGMADDESLALWESLSLGYTESPGHPLLREEIARSYAAIAPGQVLVAAPEEAIFIAMNVLLAPGDEVIVLEPAYQSLHEVARALGAKSLPWNLTAVDGSWRLDLDELRRLFSARTRLLVVNFPHNPTGYLPPKEEFAAILQLAEDAGAMVFSDEMYRGLEYREGDRLPAACDLGGHAMSLSGMSKSYSLPGLRIGWLAAQQAGLTERLQAFKDYTTICSSAPSEVLALAALRAREAILARNRAIVSANLSLAEGFFSRRAGQFEWYAPRAGSVAFPRWKGAGPVDDLCQRAVETQGVMVVPGSMFGYQGSHFRIGLGRKNFPEALERFSKAIE
jgi:aspartate/methionine/tyrosine aminotransferase